MIFFREFNGKKKLDRQQTNFDGSTNAAAEFIEVHRACVLGSLSGVEGSTSLNIRRFDYAHRACCIGSLSGVEGSTSLNIRRFD